MSAGIALTILAWLAYLASRLFRRREVPELVIFLLVGAILGPSGFRIINAAVLTQLQPLLELALAVLMFVIGERVSLRSLRSARWVVTAGVIQYAICGIAVYGISRYFGATQPVSLLLAVLAGAGAPMTVSSVVVSVRARSRYAAGIVGTHALADALASLFFAAALPVAILMSGSVVGFESAIIGFLQLGAGGALLGAALGWVVGKLGQQIETSGELLLFALVHILVASTISQFLGLSLPLAALVMGSVGASLASPDAAQRLFVAVRSIEQPLYLIFFALAGASIHLEALPALGLIGAGYIVLRSIGKIAGGTIGGLLGGLGLRQAGRLGVDLLPQAGVAVGLAVLATDILPISGREAATVVLGSVVLFELITPAFVARGLRRMEAESQTKGEPIVAEDQAPQQILLASPGRLEIPSWVIDWAARMGAGLTAMGKASEEEVDAVRDRAGKEVVSFRWIPMKGESFVGAVVRTSQEIKADMVVVLTPTESFRGRSRLMLHPHEKIARELSVPVVMLPYGGPDGRTPEGERAAAERE
jgi:Kef-type K+ transport system membrane component KefB